MKRKEAEKALLDIALEIPYVQENLFGRFSMKKLKEMISAYVAERYEIDFSDEALQGEYIDSEETADWLNSYLQEKAEPLYEHDCEACTFLGQREARDGVVGDLYRSCDSRRCSGIFRTSNEPCGYCSLPMELLETILKPETKETT